MRRISSDRCARTLYIAFALAMLAGIALTAGRYAYQWMDGAWNAQVAQAFARTGRYAVTYPEEIVFCVPITTGQTVLLPLALLFRFLGVSEMTAALVPVFYMGAALLTLEFLIVWYFCASGMSPAKSALAGGLICAACYFSFSLYGRYAYQVLGEGAALLFLLLACIALAEHITTRRRMHAALCGAMLACALITKTVAVCFLLVFGLLILFECFIMRRFSAAAIMWMAIGFVLAFCALDVIKFVQLQGGFSAYIGWWKSTLIYSLGLSSGGDGALSGAARIADNLLAAADLLAAGQTPALIVMLLTAPVCYMHSVAARLMKKEDAYAHPVRFAFMTLGLCGDGFIVASILFASSDMFTERRMLLHAVPYMAFVLAAAFGAIRQMLRFRRHLYSAGWILCAAALCMLSGVFDGIGGLLHYAHSEDAQRSQDVRVFAEAVSELRDARFYGCGWSFAAETMLLNDVVIYDLENGAPRYQEAENHYLLVESYLIERDLSADYVLTPVWQLRPGEETYSIYRIEPKQTEE